MQLLDLTTQVGWHGAVEVIDLDGAAVPWRLPASRRNLYGSGDLLRRARMPSGVRLAMRTDARLLAVDLHADDEAAPFDVAVGEAVVRRSAHDPTAFELPGTGPRDVVVWLPQHGEVAVRSVRIDDGAGCEAVRAHGPRWVVHGSSITQGRSADGPTGTWPARCARTLGLDLLNLGFGGECCLDPMVARLIRDTPADLVTLCLGINVHGAATHSARSLLPALLGFLATVCDGHPTAPVLVISPLRTLRPATERNAAGLTLGDVRGAVERAVAIMRDDGAANLVLVHGPDLLDPADPGAMADLIHPSDAGYAQIARRLTPHLRDSLETR